MIFNYFKQFISKEGTRCYSQMNQSEFWVLGSELNEFWSDDASEFAVRGLKTIYSLSSVHKLAVVKSTVGNIEVVEMLEGAIYDKHGLVFIDFSRSPTSQS